MMRTGATSAVKTTAKLGRGRWPTVIAVVVTLILYAVAWPTLPLTHDTMPQLMPLVAGFAVFPFVFVFSRPALGWAVTALAALVIPLAFERVGDYTYPWQVVHIIVLLALVLAVSVLEEIRVVLVVWIATVLLFFLYMPGDDGWGWMVGLTALVVFGLLVRWLVISRRQLAHEEEVSELERARRAVLEEKARIARDLHDIVAHHMSMVVVQAQSAPYRLTDVTDEVRAEFDSLGATAREALNEVRSLLGVLRSDGYTPENEPQPGVERIGELLAASQRAGVRLNTEITGEPVGVSDGVGLAVYRILQESLTNSARHAPGAAVDVRIRWSPGTVEMAVTNGPRTEAVEAVVLSDRNGGSGIRGMGERAATVGGRLVAHPRPDGGFEVHAVLPTVVAV
ncbi:sensor histidine kinase [Rhodococcus sp. HNM0563]|uniref:sensor histidine kinase n=1 Tax=unclassified Rhodococcus (in: high G+C Gram-positive bacteria) TaxID=192944 RepID=UPI00146AE0DE|nr:MULTISPECIES: histidine kinase [unclassified Rhodococcus (in: high G+C Gram-positive bacteria)]MCK0090958.1 histidine kinase [Rhodococcus sp. F64268]NLU61000.1 sensor histidine kinase [Rhodococcus sp. HNM0563]